MTNIKVFLLLITVQCLPRWLLGFSWIKEGSCGKQFIYKCTTDIIVHSQHSRALINDLQKNNKNHWPSPPPPLPPKKIVLTNYRKRGCFFSISVVFFPVMFKRVHIYWRAKSGKILILITTINLSQSRRHTNRYVDFSKSGVLLR